MICLAACFTSTGELHERVYAPHTADFYYGEMEMRRQDPSTPWPEGVILWLYWLVSGYGLRGLRALASLAVVVLGLAMLLHLVGYATHPSPASVWGSLL